MDLFAFKHVYTSIRKYFPLYHNPDYFLNESSFIFSFAVDVDKFM